MLPRFVRRDPRLKKLYVRARYRLLAHLLPPCRFMNLGHPPIDGFAVRPEDHLERRSLTLYHRLCRDAQLDGKAVLEVGCGRGGGAWYLSRYRRPARVVATDLAPKNVELCRRSLDLGAVEYAVADAEALPYDGEFDVVLNVESSHNYPRRERFIAGVARALRPGGVFLYADVLEPARWREVDRWLGAKRLRITRDEDVSREVAAAIAASAAFNREYFREHSRLPGFLVRRIIVLDGSEVYDLLRSGGLVYRVVHAAKA